MWENFFEIENNDGTFDPVCAFCGATIGGSWSWDTPRPGTGESIFYTMDLLGAVEAHLRVCSSFRAEQLAAERGY